MSNETPYEATDVEFSDYYKNPKLCNKWIIKGTVESITVKPTKTSQYVLITFVHDLDHKVVINNGRDFETYSADEVKYVLKQIYDRNENDFIEKIIRGYLISVGCREPQHGIKYFHNFNSIMIWDNSNYRVPSDVDVGSKIAVSVVDNQISIKSNGTQNFVNHRVCSDIVGYDENPDLATTIRRSNEKKIKKEQANQNKFVSPPRIKRTKIEDSDLISTRRPFPAKKVISNGFISAAKSINFGNALSDKDLGEVEE